MIHRGHHRRPGFATSPRGCRGAHPGRDRMTGADWVALGAALDDAAYRPLRGAVRPRHPSGRLTRRWVGQAGWMRAWTCPDCGRRFGRTRQSHDCNAGDDAGRVLRHRTAAREAGVRCGDAPPRTRGPGLRGARVRGIFLKNPRKFAELRPRALDRTVVLSAAPGGHRTIVRRVVRYGEDTSTSPTSPSRRTSTMTCATSSPRRTTKPRARRAWRASLADDLGVARVTR